jgi:pimeloyl-ACP methyl ester carboxylesterase
MRQKTSAVLTLGFLAAIGVSSLLAISQASKEQKVDVGGCELFTSQAGSGEPVVVFEAGLGEDTSTWQSVLPQVAQFAHTFAYDRAGLGKSDSSPNPKTVEQMVKELQGVLTAGHVPPPYVLVGHSLGGAVIQLFAHTYPNEVAGLVLVDPEDGRLLERLQARLPKEEWDAREKTLAQMMAGASPAQKAEIEGSKSSGKALAAAVPLPDVPMVLLTGTLKDPSFPGNPMEQDLKLQLQEEFLKTAPHGDHVLVPNSRHYIQEDAPQLVIDAIRKVVSQSRKPAQQARS